MRQLITLLLAAGVTVLSTAPAYADIDDPLFKLLPSDGAAFHDFGRSVGISGIRAIVGAAGDTDNGIDSGSAYLFDITTAQQLVKLLPNDGAEFEAFGGSVAIDGIRAIVGKTGDEANGVESGSAYLFDTTTGQQLFKLLATDGAESDEFGGAVAIGGIRAVVGARWDDDNGDASGSAYLFDTTTGQQIAKLLPNDGAEGDRFGGSVAISGTRSIVGADADGDNGSFSGSAYLFDVTNGQQVFKLLPDDGAAFHHFGHSVAISGVTAIVGAYGDDDNGPNSGSAYLFDVTYASLQGGDPVDWNADGDNTDPDAPVDISYMFTSYQNPSPGETLSGHADWPNLRYAMFGEDFADGVHNSTTEDTEMTVEIFNELDSIPPPPVMCVADLDGNGSVGASDLLALLASWGPCKGCPADFDGNGNVGASDLLTLLANWGPCP